MDTSYTTAERATALQHAANLLRDGDIPETAFLVCTRSAGVEFRHTLHGSAEDFVRALADLADRLGGVEFDITFRDGGKPTAVHTFSTGLQLQVEGWCEVEKTHVGDEVTPVFEYRLPELTDVLEQVAS